MQAIVVEQFGGPEVLRQREAPDPVAGPGDVLVELRASAVNRHDLFYRQGQYEVSLPLILGSDGAGVRRDTREEVVILPALDWGPRDAAPGPDFRILGAGNDGPYAELVSVPEENLFPRPARLSWEEAAALPLCGLTAQRALFTRGELRGGETLLVLGAGSGVSTLAIALARQAGATVLVTTSSEAKLDRAAQLGAAGGALYTRDGWADEIRALAGGEGVDVVLDSVGSTWPDSLRCARPGGRVVVLGRTGGIREVTLGVRDFYFSQHSLLGTTVGSPRDFEALLEATAGGSWVPVLDSVRPIGEASAAHARVESGEHFGKLVLTL